MKPDFEKDPLLDSWLKSAGTEDTPQGFLDNVMGKVRAESKRKAVKPLLSWPFWVAAAGITGATIVAGISVMTPDVTSPLMAQAAEAVEDLGSFLSNMNISPVWLIVFAAAGLLFAADRLLFRRKNRG